MSKSKIKASKATPKEEELRILDPQVELRRVFAWTVEIADTLVQMHHNIVQLKTDKIATTAMIESLEEQLQEYATELEDVKLELTDLKKNKFRIAGLKAK
jgi:cell division protein FtsL